MSVESSISEEDLVPPSPIKKNFENPYIKVRRKEYDFDNQSSALNSTIDERKVPVHVLN